MQELIKHSYNNLKYWQDKQKHEVDIVIDLISKQIPMEVKFKEKLKHEDFIGMNAFTNMHKAKKKYIVNLGVQDRERGVNLMLPFNIGRIK